MSLCSHRREAAAELNLDSSVKRFCTEKYGVLLRMRLKWDILLRNNPNLLNFSHSTGIKEWLSPRAIRYGIIVMRVCV